MNHNTLWSLRLGFSNKEASKIAQKELGSFLESSFAFPFDATIPSFLDDSPKTKLELKEQRGIYKTATEEERKESRKKDRKTSEDMKAWWIDRMYSSEFPLREKMTCFWHNHYVSTIQKVKVNYWVFQHNQILRKHAFGNFKTLTKEIIKTNAVVRYLDNNDNRKAKLNENLSRELLELFTLGIGNYSEQDIKNGAKGLAGIDLGEESAVYKAKFKDNEAFEYLGKKGSFKIDEMIDIIFEQPNIPFLITRKILKWFIYDTPSEELVEYYGTYFKEQNFEIQALLTKIFTEEYAKNTAGSKIKNPLEYILQLLNELNVQNPDGKVIAKFCKDQGMDFFNQPNVKGWVGGNYWITSQLFLQRNNVADLLCKGKPISRNKSDNSNTQLKIKLNWDNIGNNKEIITELKDRLLFQIDDIEQQNFEKILKYDFNSKSEGADYAVLRLFNYMVKTPEFQLL